MRGEASFLRHVTPLPGGVLDFELIHQAARRSPATLNCLIDLVVRFSVINRTISSRQPTAPPMDWHWFAKSAGLDLVIPELIKRVWSASVLARRSGIEPDSGDYRHLQGVKEAERCELGGAGI